MRKEVEEALHSLPPDELVEARRYIDRLLATLSRSDALTRPAPEGAVDRRQFERFSINLPVTFFRHAATDKGEGVVQDALVRDISRSGIRFFTGEAIEPEEVLTLYLPSPLGVRKLFVEVRWTERRGRQYECGASFVGLDRIFAAQRAEEQRSEAARVLVACEPCPERDALADLLVKQGYTAYMANTVPEACAMLEFYTSALVLASGPMLLTEEGRLLKAINALGDKVLSVAMISASDLDDPQNAPLRSCHDFLAEPDKAQEVRVVVGRSYRRLSALRARQASG